MDKAKFSSGKVKIGLMLALIAILAFFSILSFSTLSDSGLNCTIVEDASCGGTKLLYLRNDSGGYYNAHAQLPSVGTYPYVICCDANNRSDTLDTACGDSVFLRLYDTTNTHVQMSNISTYTNDACINAVSGTVSCNYTVGACGEGYSCLASMASSEAADVNQTNAHLGNCSYYQTSICCKINSPPTRPILDTPENMSQITNRSQRFVWNSTDPDGDTMTFDMWIYCHGGCSIDNREYLGISQYNLTQSNFSIPSELRFFSDDNYWYTWKVRAYDGIAYSENSSESNFTLAGLVSITLINNTINFGNMSGGQSDGTDDDSPYPFVLRNDGNVFVDVNISAVDLLWENYPNPSSYYQYKIANFTAENSSFNWTGSVTDWTNIPFVNQTIINVLNYSDATDQAEIDIRVQVPYDEIAGQKSSQIQFAGKYVRVDI